MTWQLELKNIDSVIGMNYNKMVIKHVGVIV